MSHVYCSDNPPTPRLGRNPKRALHVWVAIGIEHTISRRGVENRFVTFGGECFDAKFEGEERDGRRIGTVHLFRLRDVRSGRGELLVSLFGSEQIKLLNPSYAARVEVARINAIRRAFDAGKLSFDKPYEEHTYQPLDMKDSDFKQQPLVGDPEIRQFMMHEAYWVSYRHPTHPGEYPINFETPEDLDYLGATQADIRRNVLRLKNQGLLDKVLDGFGKPTEELIAAYESKLNTPADTESGGTLHDMPTQRPATHRGLSIFISHSRKDADLAQGLIDLLRAGLALTADQIRCSSVDGYRLPVGVNTEGKLREEVNAAKAVVGLITPSSLSSYYVMFELGARWGANLFLAPLLAGVNAGELSGPLSLLNALSASSDAQLLQLLGDMADHLGLPLQPAASYIRNVTAVKALADAIANPTSAQPAAAAPVKQKLRVTVSAEGTPPSQVLKVLANRQVEVLRVEYMLSNGTTIASEDASRQGESVEIPVNTSLLAKVWGTPRADRNFSDHSGPAKICVTVSADGEPQEYILPVQMDSLFLNSSMYIKLVGSKTFYG